MSNEEMTFEELQNKLDEINTKHPDIDFGEIITTDEDDTEDKNL